MDDLTRNAGQLAQQGVASVEAYGWTPHIGATKTVLQRGQVGWLLYVCLFGLMFTVGVSWNHDHD